MRVFKGRTNDCHAEEDYGRLHCWQPRAPDLAAKTEVD